MPFIIRRLIIYCITAIISDTFSYLFKHTIDDIWLILAYLY